MASELELRPAKPVDREYIEALLTQNALPTADLPEKLSCLYVCEVKTKQVGVGGLEQHQEVGLLRSVAIEESGQGNGYGKMVCNKLLERARSEDISTVYLLTTTAEGFFTQLGFKEVARENVPPSIQSTSEFKDLCPASAVCMKCDLKEPTENA